jgi:hypothetical protein
MSTATASSTPATSPRSTRRLHADHRPRQGRDQVRRRVDLLDRSRERRLGHPAVAEAAAIGAAHDKWEERPLLIVVRKAGQERQPGGDTRLPSGQGRHLVAAGRCRLRGRTAAHRHRQAAQAASARAVQGLSTATRGLSEDAGPTRLQSSAGVACRCKSAVAAAVSQAPAGVGKPRSPVAGARGAHAGRAMRSPIPSPMRTGRAGDCPSGRAGFSAVGGPPVGAVGSQAPALSPRT